MLNFFGVFANHAEFFQHVLFDKNSLFIVLPSIQHLFQNLDINVSPGTIKLQTWKISIVQGFKKLIEGPVKLKNNC